MSWNSRQVKDSRVFTAIRGRAEALELVRGLRGLELVGADVVEVSPPFDHAQLTSMAGATVAYEQ